MIKRGLSSLIGEVLMISLVFVVGIFVYKWISGFSSKHLDNSEEGSYSMTQCAIVQATLDEFFYDTATQQFKIMITNKASSQYYVIEKIEIYNSRGERCLIDKVIKLLPGETKFFTFSCNENFITDCNEFRSLAIISACKDKSLYYGKALTSTLSSVCKM